MAEYTFDELPVRSARDVSRAFRETHRRRLRYSSLTRFRGGHLQTWATTVSNERQLPYLAVLNELQGGQSGSIVRGLSTAELLVDEASDDGTSTISPNSINTRTHDFGLGVAFPRIACGNGSTVFDFSDFSIGDQLAIRFDADGDTWQNYVPYTVIHVNGNRLYFNRPVPDIDDWSVEASDIKSFVNPTEVSIVKLDNSRL